MTNKKSTKKALITSALCLLLCLSMLVGTTFAWFTDEVKSGTNIIAAGNLDIELYHSDKAVKDEKVNGGTKLFDDVMPSLWEPGAVAYEVLTVKNEGTLALKYNLAFHALNATVVNGKSLADALKIAVVDETELTSRESAIEAGEGNWKPLASFDLPETLEAGQSHTYGVVIYWEPTDNDNDFNMNNENQGKTLSIEIGVHLTATQYTHEEDGFDKYYDGAIAWNGGVDTDWYDADATELTIGSAEELAGLAQLVNNGTDSFAGKTIKLVSNLNLDNLAWTPISSAEVDDSIFVGFQGTFDGQGYTIANLNVEDDTWGLGLFGYLSSKNVVVKNVNVHNASVKGTDCAGIIVGYATYGSFSNIHVTGDVVVSGSSADGHVGGIAGCGYYASFENCSVSGATITSNGSFNGGIVGYQCANTKAITNCKVTDTTITGYAAVGGVAGLIASGTTLSGNIVENVVLTKTRVGGFPTVGALIGCYSGSKDTALADCSVKNVTLNGTNEEYAAYNELYGAGYDAKSAAKFDVTTTTVDGIINNLGWGTKATPADIQAVINAANAGDVIILAAGKYHDTIVMKSGITLQGTNGAIVDCINLNGASNVTLKGITFDAAGAKYSYAANGKAVQPANIISRSSGSTVAGAADIVIEDCVFNGTFADGGVVIAFTDQGTTGYSNITIKGCAFKAVGGYADIYTYYSGNNGAFVIEGNTFASKYAMDVSNMLPIYLGKYQSAVPVAVKGNAFENKASFAAAAYLQDHGSYGVSFDAADNTFAN